MKKTLLTLLVICSIFVVGCGKKSNSTNTGENGGSSENNGSTETKKDGITVETTRIEYNDGVAWISFVITNNSDKAEEVDRVEIVYEVDGKQKKLTSIIDDTLVPGTKIELSNATSDDLTAIKYSYNVVKKTK